MLLPYQPPFIWLSCCGQPRAGDPTDTAAESAPTRLEE